MPKKNLFDEDDEEAEGSGLGINKDYADRYENWRRLEEMQKLKDKLGKNAALDEDDGESDDSSESEESPEWTADDEKDFLRALGALKSKDPKIYQNDVRFFKKEQQETKNDSASEKGKKKSGDKPMFLKDYERKLVLERGGELSEDDDDADVKPNSNGLSYHENEKRLKEELKRAMHGDDSDDDGILQKRVKTEEEKAKDDEDYYEWLKGNAHIAEKDQDLEKLKKRWSSQNLDKDEQFLRDYLLNRQYEEGDVDDQVPTYEEIVGIEESEEHEQKAEEFEHKYNFRFEEPDQEFIKSYPRTVNASLRKTDTKRKERRDELKARKASEKQQRREEIRQLKAMKRSAIEEKLRKLREIAGDDSVPLSVEDLEKDFDPAEYDRKMQEVFAQEYYEKGADEEEKPVFSDMSSDEESNYDEMEIAKADAVVKAESQDGENGVGPDEDEAEDEPGPSRRDKKKKRKRNSKFRDAVARHKPVFDPNEKTFEEYFNEYYALDYEDIIADNLVTKFKYRSVPANSFGLTTEEILTADDKQLNAWASVKKTTQYRSEQEERLDQIAYARKAQNVEKKKRIFQSALISNQPKKKTEHLVDAGDKAQNSKNKNKKKKGDRKEGAATARADDLDNERLRAYGVSTKKLKRRLYGKKMDQINADKTKKGAKK